MHRKCCLKVLAAAGAFGFMTVAATLAQQRDKCTSVIVNKDLTADGSVILGHNEDLSNYSAHHYFHTPRATHDAGEVVTTFYGAKVPQVPLTYAYTGTTLFDISYSPGAVTSGVNEYQVAVVNNASYRRDAPSPLPSEGRLIWTEFTKFALERAKTAEEAVDVIGALASTYKLGADSGSMFGVTDTKEGWWVEVTLDGQWIAERTQSGSATVRANIFRIGEIKDAKNFKYSDDLISYAVAKGWYDPKDTFNFTTVYAEPTKVDSQYNLRRENRVKDLLQTSVAAKTVAPQLIMSIWRDHYEGTKYDLTDGHRLGSPHQTEERTLCRMDTEVSTVIQSRAQIKGQDVPADIGALCWRAMATPCSSIYTPWYLGSLEVPKEYQTGDSQFTKKSAYWTARNLSKSLDMRYRDAVVDEVKRVQSKFEDQEFASQDAIEKKALELYAKDTDAARTYLTKYTSKMAKKAMGKLNGLYKYAERH